MSRFPIIRSALDWTQQYMTADIDIYGTTVRFFNVHILLHIEPGNPLKPSFYRALKNRYIGRQAGFKNLYADVKNLKLAYVIAGDFNSSKAMGVMNDLFADNIDSVKYSNEFIPFTFEFMGLKLWRFDYILINRTNQTLKIIAHQNINPEELSDHSAQLITIGLMANH